MSNVTLDAFDSAVEKLLKETLDGKPTPKPVVKAFSEYVKIFTRECIGRAYQEASSQDPSIMNEGGSYTIDVQHIEKVIPQLLLDFC